MAASPTRRHLFPARAGDSAAVESIVSENGSDANGAPPPGSRRGAPMRDFLNQLGHRIDGRVMRHVSYAVSG